MHYNYRHPYEDNGHAHREKREYHSNAKEARNTLRHGDQRWTSAAALAASASPMVTVTFAVISRKSTTDTFLLLNMERGDHTHSYYDRGLMAHSKIDMISIIGRYCM